MARKKTKAPQVYGRAGLSMPAPPPAQYVAPPKPGVYSSAPVALDRDTQAQTARMRADADQTWKGALVSHEAQNARVARDFTKFRAGLNEQVQGQREAAGGELAGLGMLRSPGASMAVAHKIQQRMQEQLSNAEMDKVDRLDALNAMKAEAERRWRRSLADITDIKTRGRTNIADYIRGLQ